MSLGKPDLYIGGQLMQTLKTDPRPALAGLRIGWGNDSRLELDPASTLSGQLLIKGAMPSFLDIGTPVGLIDPISSRCLFAGNLGPLTAAPDDSVRDALRVTFTAASPYAELVKHKALNVDWPHEEIAISRRPRLKNAMPRGWVLTGAEGWDWINSGRQKYAAIDWPTLAERYVRSFNQRYHDTSTYTPGAGLYKRITITEERNPTMGGTPPGPGTRGIWTTTGKPQSATGVAVIPTSAVGRGIEWEKTPADLVTDVQVSSWGGAVLDEGEDSHEFEYWMGTLIDNTAMQDAYGFRQVKIETALSSYNGGALDEAIRQIYNRWLYAQTSWRPTTLQLPDSRALDAAPLLNLLAVDTRHMAAISVPDATAAPGAIRSYVMAGQATWTGKKWTTDLTLGRTLS